MANPTVKPGIPKSGSLLAALWISDQIDQAGTPSKGAWDAVTGTFYPAYGGSNLTPVTVPGGSRNALRAAAAACGIELDTTNDGSSGWVNSLGTEFAIVALVRRQSVAATDWQIIQNEPRSSPPTPGGWSMRTRDATTGAARERVSGAGAWTSASKTVGYPNDEWMLMTYQRGADGYPWLWKNDVRNSDTGSAATGARVMPTSGYERRPAIFNWSAQSTLNAVPGDIAAILVFSDGDWAAGDIQSLGGTSSGGVLVNPNAVLAAVFDFGDSPTGPTITSQPTAQTANEGTAATYVVAATASSGSLTYQWQRAEPGSGTFANVPTGGTSATYVTGTLGCAADNGAQYRCNVTDAAGTTASSAVGLTVPSVTTTARPDADVSGVGWVASTGSDLFAMIDEGAASSADYMESPAITGTPEWGIVRLKYPLAAGDRMVNVQGWVPGSTGTMKTQLLNDSGTVMGTPADQAVTATPTVYALPVTLTGLATRLAFAFV